MDDLRIYEEIIKHIWYNAHLSNRGYDTLTDEQKSIFNGIIGEKPSDRSVWYLIWYSIHIGTLHVLAIYIAEATVGKRKWEWVIPKL